MNMARMVEYKLERETEVGLLVETPPPVSLCPPQIPHRLTWGLPGPTNLPRRWCHTFSACFHGPGDAKCSLVLSYQGFGRMLCFHLQGRINYCSFYLWGRWFLSNFDRYLSNYMTPHFRKLQSPFLGGSRRFGGNYYLLLHRRRFR
jgi:hypothetical protein